MSIFDESDVEAGHLRLASAISESWEILAASTDLIRKVLLAEDRIRTKEPERRTYIAASVLDFRIVNGAGAATKLLDYGYFIQATGLFRDISEFGMLMLLFSEQPRELEVWRQAESDRHKMFGRSQLKQKIKNLDEFDFFNNYFNAFSEFGTHPSAVSVVAHLDGSDWHIGPHVNERLYIDGYRDLSLLVWRTTNACGATYKAIFGAVAGEDFAIEVARYQNAWERIARNWDGV